MTLELLTEKALKAVEDAVKATEADNQFKTNVLNAEYSCGKYHAYMELIEEIDLDNFVKIHESVSEKLNKVLEYINQIYQRY